MVADIPKEGHYCIFDQVMIPPGGLLFLRHSPLKMQFGDHNFQGWHNITAFLTSLDCRDFTQLLCTLPHRGTFRT